MLLELLVRDSSTALLSLKYPAFSTQSGYANKEEAGPCLSSTSGMEHFLKPSLLAASTLELCKIALAPSICAAKEAQLYAAEWDHRAEDHTMLPCSTPSGLSPCLPRSLFLSLACSPDNGNGSYTQEECSIPEVPAEDSYTFCHFRPGSSSLFSFGEYFEYWLYISAQQRSRDTLVGMAYFDLHVGLPVRVKHAHQCPGTDGNVSHVKSLTLRQFPVLEMSLHCDKVQSFSEKLCSVKLHTVT